MKPTEAERLRGTARVLTARIACAAWRLCERLAGEPPWDADTKRYREPLPAVFRLLYVPCHALHVACYPRARAALDRSREGTEP